MSEYHIWIFIFCNMIHRINLIRVFRAENESWNLLKILSIDLWKCAIIKVNQKWSCSRSCDSSIIYADNDEYTRKYLDIPMKHKFILSITSFLYMNIFIWFNLDKSYTLFFFNPWYLHLVLTDQYWQIIV
jgi:hypothetical protein